MAETKRDETYLGWLARRSAYAKARLEAMQPITPIETPLLALLKKQAAKTNG
jgi:hypothetical protein